ncbi:peptidoglycan DD-metalloendopeptidase family protein [Cecembia sp.]|uniref:peptidoglycan DD-metalloendopeptidase family protein n=1 Tax=Cecembia sp. TaxID=1898110 RepID=UPI0025B96843|nr:peptidoglycan DD-metalloendopeptidase family protein [Cecembia sp.]
MEIKIREGPLRDKIFILQPMEKSLKLLIQEEQVFPLMGKFLDRGNTLWMDFSPANEELKQVDFSDTLSFDHYVFSKLRAADKQFGIGGYFEQRAIYARSGMFATDQADFRNIHLGIDVWTESGHPVYAPLEGKIHAFQNNSGFGDYGATIILEHQLKDTVLYSLYGHLALKDLEGLELGMPVACGQKFCQVGPFPENGDWPPHLHFQLMWDMLGNWGDFPGVCSQREIEKYSAICPDPQALLGYLPR